MEEVCLSPRETIKILLMGDHKVGKTTFLRTHIDIYQDNDGITLQPSIYMRNYIDGVVNINFMFIDTPGHRSLQNLNTFYIQNLEVLILAFDLGNERSFYELPKRIQDLEQINPRFQRSNGKYPVIILGINKKCPEEIDNCLIEDKKIMEYVKRNNFIYVPSDMDDPVEEIYRQIINYRMKAKRDNNRTKNCVGKSCGAFSRCSVM